MAIAIDRDLLPKRHLIPLSTRKYHHRRDITQTKKPVQTRSADRIDLEAEAM